MSKNIDHFIFIPGLGAGAKDPMANTINHTIERETGIPTEIAPTCQEFEQIHIPYPLDRQAEELTNRIKQLHGRVAIFAHSVGGIPTAMALANEDFPQVNPEDVIFAATPLNSQHPKTRLERVIAVARRRGIEAELVESTRASLRARNMADLAIHSVVPLEIPRSTMPTQHNVFTPEHMKSYPEGDEHLNRLRLFGASTLLICENEKVTDCTVKNVAELLPDRTSTNTIVVGGADHNLNGLYENTIPQLIFQQIPGLAPEYGMNRVVR